MCQSARSSGLGTPQLFIASAGGVTCITDAGKHTQYLVFDMWYLTLLISLKSDHTSDWFNIPPCPSSVSSLKVWSNFFYEMISKKWYWHLISTIFIFCDQWCYGLIIFISPLHLIFLDVLHWYLNHELIPNFDIYPVCKSAQGENVQGLPGRRTLVKCCNKLVHLKRKLWLK